MKKFLFLLFLAGVFLLPSISLAQDYTPEVPCWVCDPREYKPLKPDGPDLPTGADNKCDKPVDTTDPTSPTVRDYCQQGLLPFCARTKLGCTTIGDIGLAAINYARFIFGISGSVALLFVVIGGVMMMVSFGNQELMTRGRSTLTAAVIGLVIIFSAYLIVGLVIRALDVEAVSEFASVVSL